MKKNLQTTALALITALFGSGIISCNPEQAGTGQTSTGHNAMEVIKTSHNDQDKMAQQKWTNESVKNHVKNWKESPKKAANQMIDKYGVPDEVTTKRLVWNDKGDFAQTMITNEEIDHDFPMPHKDCLLQTVNYDIPVDMYTNIAKYDGSVILERTKGTMSARCDAEPANYLALNLTYDISQGKKTVEEARKFYGETIVSLKKGEKPEYTQKLMFTPKKSAGDSDKPVIDGSVMKELMGKK